MALGLAPDEEVLREGTAAVTKGMFGGRWGPLVLTNRRLIWSEAGWIWPLKRQHREIDLADVLRAEHKSKLDFVFGGKQLRIRLRNGRLVKFF